jgi:cytochrome c oxidase assembly protein subunit 15
VAIYAYILWMALNLISERAPTNPPPGLRRFGHAVTALVFLMILSGGFVAGTKAGFAFNTFPLMNGRFIPEGMYAMQPFWTNLFENIATVQFNHRLLAYLLCILIPLFWWQVMRADVSYRARRAAQLLLGWLAVQVALGIATLVHVTPVSLGALHQAGALVLFSLALYTMHTLRHSHGV